MGRRTISQKLAQKYRQQAGVDGRLAARPPDLADFPVAAPGSYYDPGTAFGWGLPNGLVLFLWATPPYPRLTDVAAMPNPLSGFIGVPGGYHADVGRAVAAAGPFAGLPVVWAGMCGSPLVFRWVGPEPDGQSWFMFNGAQGDLDGLFHRAEAFASGYAGPADAPDPGRT